MFKNKIDGTLGTIGDMVGTACGTLGTGGGMVGTVSGTVGDTSGTVVLSVIHGRYCWWYGRYFKWHCRYCQRYNHVQ